MLSCLTPRRCVEQETQKREAEERERRQLEETARIEKEESERKAREEAERQRVEMAERLKREEEERQARRRRVEAIMKRTRNNAPNSTAKVCKRSRQCIQTSDWRLLSLLVCRYELG